MNDTVSHDVRSKLEERVKAAGMMERFVSVEAEKMIVMQAVENGLAADYAANVVAAISVEKGYAREAELNHILSIVLRHLAGDGVDRKEFDEAVAIAGELAHGVIPIPKLRKKAKQLMIDNGLAAQSGGFFSADWFKGHLMSSAADAETVDPAVRSRLEESVKAAGMQSRVLTAAAERGLVGKAVDAGLSVDYAQKMISAIAFERGCIREVEVRRVLLVILKAFAKQAPGGKIDQAHFETAVKVSQELGRDQIPVPTLQQMAKQLMIDQGIPAESGGFLKTDWFKAIQSAPTSMWQQYKNENNMF